MKGDLALCEADQRRKPSIRTALRPRSFDATLLVAGSDADERARRGGPAGPEPFAPAHQEIMDGSRADDRLLRARQVRRMEDERPGLGPTEAAVERDQLFESAALVEIGVVKAVHEDVGSVRERVRAEQVRSSVRRE